MIRCPYCESAAKLVGGDAIYRNRPDLAGLKFWLCEPCGAYVGTHKGSPRNAPLGRLANAELRALKQQVHAAFDPLWKEGKMSRREAYALLADTMDYPHHLCHVGMFNEHQCRAVLKVLRAGLAQEIGHG